MTAVQPHVDFYYELHFRAKVCVCERSRLRQVVTLPQLQLRKKTKRQTANAICFFVGSPNWTRTSDTLINSQVLYRLSYGGK